MYCTRVSFKLISICSPLAEFYTRLIIGYYWFISMRADVMVKVQFGNFMNIYTELLCCRYYIKTPSMQLALSGCSFECYKEQEVQSCCPGYWGPDCMECPDRADKPCSGKGVCSEGLGGNGTCSCQVTSHLCYRWVLTRLFFCSAVCLCVHGLCDSGLTGNGRCTCFSGYKGPTCEQESPACAALSCQQNSRCMEEALTGQLVCQCLPGYQKSGDQCLSINPCLQRVCHVQATCVHTGPNQHQCTCNQGYSGDGRVCMAVDPCQTNQAGCDARSARCVYNGPGKSHCECLPGFDLLSNGSCVLKESCKPDSCHKNANCSTVEPGRVQCTCLQGYLGNGKVCYGNIMQRLIDLNTEPGGQWSGQLSNAIALFDSLSWPLQNLGPFTIFVPTNKGFRGTPVRTLTADVSKAKYCCKMHLVAGVMPFDTLKTTDVFYTLTGKSAEVDTSDGVRRNLLLLHRRKGLIVQSDVVASNGMIHVISRLMDSVSATVESNPELDSIMDLPGPITVFAPSSSAFDGMLEGYLQYLSSDEGHNKLVELLRNHIVPSTSVSTNFCSSLRSFIMTCRCFYLNMSRFSVQGQILVNGAAVMEAAVEAKNGRLYVMDGVLIPPSIEPVLPHRCDVTETKIGDCVSCSKPTSDQSCCKGFYGPDCRPCPGGYQTSCSGHGQCLDGIEGNGTCICEANFRGSRCQYCSSPNKYGPNCDRTCPCIHGQCENRPDSDGRCKPDSCLPRFTGRFCERSTAFCGIVSQFCHAHAESEQTTFYIYTTSRPFSLSFSCVCKPGFQGDGITCVETDPCAPPLRGGCSVNAKCIKTGPGKHTCQCLTGWKPDGDECQPINNCDGPNRGGCHDNATCIYVGPGQWKCVCEDEYVGDGRTCYGSVQQVSDGGRLLTFSTFSSILIFFL
uniref:Stabilin 2 n=1 Tax=Amphiprion percula TaxID=161767 RepID=A0A3P8UCE2_AMPPE